MNDRLPLAQHTKASLDALYDERDQARATNQRLNLRAQRMESELATYRRAVASWQVSERGTYITHASLCAIGKAGGVDLLGSVRHLKHFERVEQAEKAAAGLAQAIRLTREYVGADLLPAVEGWSWYDALRRWAPHELAVNDADQAPAASCSPATAETEPNNPAATEATKRPTLRERHRAQWLALTDTERAARIAALDEDDEPEQPERTTPDNPPTSSDEADNPTGAWTPDPPIGCLTVTAEPDPFGYEERERTGRNAGLTVEAEDATPPPGS